MLSIDHVSAHELLDLQDGLREKLKSCMSLESSSQVLAETIHAAFGEEVVLCRVFITLPFHKLPEDLRRTARAVVEDQVLHSQTTDNTAVLTLLGSSGKDLAWCSRHTSRGHAAIPLSSANFVDSIPMVARMLQEMGIDLGLTPEAGRPFSEKILGTGWVGLFYVDDARTARDGAGRRVIPATDFVERHSIRTVFGIGKALGNGSIASLVLFTNSLMSRRKVEDLVPLVNLFRASTIELVKAGTIFEQA